MLQLGAGWLKRRGQSQEYFDSWVICVWVRNGLLYSGVKILMSSGGHRVLLTPLQNTTMPGIKTGATRVRIPTFR
jgi:hypothetical protein